MAATVRRKQFPLRCAAFLAGQILFASRFSTALRPQAVQPARPPPAGSQQGRDGREPCSTERRKHHGQHRHLHRRQRRLHRHASHPDAQRQGQAGSQRQGHNENAPDFRLQAASHDIGAAWKKTSEAGREYVSVTLDDPSFPATVYARLIEGEDGTHDLIWSRSKPQAA
jgi:uncharacterized protein (DUF736 family)